LDYQSIWHYIRGRILVPDEIIKREEKILLHISDTPHTIFKAIDELIEMIQPEYIVHTGDLVDNLKLEIYPGLKIQYEKDVEDILRIISKSRIRSYIALGNHDLETLVDRSGEKLSINKDMIEENIEGHMISINHYFQPDSNGEIFLYGHDAHQSNQDCDLNGIFHIHVIFLKSMRVVRLKYPWGTKDQRMLKRKIGI
jgi:predicted MPP superfamily phosphohydrolase